MEEGVEEKSKKIAELAPVVGISQAQRFEAAVGRFEQASRPSRA
jgi:hypothetical protein